jgi:hypothetical protein
MWHCNVWASRLTNLQKISESTRKCLKIAKESVHEGACRGQRLYMTGEMKHNKNARRGSDSPGFD